MDRSGGRRYRSGSAALVLSWMLANAGAQTTGIRIVIVEGQGAINNIQQRRAKEPVVQVVDENNAPVQGAAVTFQSPDTGPSGVFGESSHMLTLMTDEKGQATGRGLRPNQAPGRFQIRVTASFHGQTASAAIAQINAEPAKASSGSKKFLLIALIGGAAAGGLVAARGGHSAGATQVITSNNPPPTVLVPGTPVVQPPH